MTPEKHPSDHNKDVIYLDVDEDITGIIAKVKASNKRIVALVLPKRFATMQSTVNMKLLKRAAERGKQNLVLITSESSLMPLAGAAGVHVAKTLQSKPEVPDLPAGAAPIDEDEVEEAIAHDPAPESPQKLDSSKSIGELAADDDEESIEIDNSAPEPAKNSKDDKKAAKVKGKKDKKLKIPNFNKFRTWLIVGGVAVVLLTAGLIWAFAFAPKADIFISTDSTAVTSSGEITLDTSDGAVLDVEEGVIPATAVETKQSKKAEVEATGQKNNGKKATGTMTLVNCSNQVVKFSAGTGFSAGGKTFISDKAVSIPQSSYSFTSNGFVCDNNGQGSVAVTAQNGGADHNIGAQSYTIASGVSNVSAKGSAMKGGTDDIVKIVTQADIDKAKQQIQEQQDPSVEQQLSGELQAQGMFAIAKTLTNQAGEASASAQPDDQAEKVTVTQELTYKMLGVKRQDLESVIADTVADKIDDSRQAILSYGLEEADFTLQNQSSGETLVGLRTTVTAGPDINIDDIKSQVAGLKSSEAKPIIEDYPGVVSVDIKYGPFWVRSIPKKTDKINITIEEPEVVESSSNTEASNAAEQ